MCKQTNSDGLFRFDSLAPLRVESPKENLQTSGQEKEYRALISLL